MKKSFLLLACIATSFTDHARIRWGILSTARFNEKMIPAIRASSESEVVAIASRDLEKARACANKHNIPRAYGSYEELIEDPAIDVNFNPLPNSLHAEWTVRAAKAGKHVLCEKPLTTSLADFERIEHAAHTYNVTIFEGFAYRFHPQTERLLSMLADKKIGDVQAINTWFYADIGFFKQGSGPLPSPIAIRLDPALGGGCLWDLGGYCAGIAMLIAGDKEPLAVWAHARKGPSGVDMITHATLIFDQDVVAHIEVSYATHYSVGLYIYGTLGSLFIEDPWRPGLLASSTMHLTTNFNKKEQFPSLTGESPYVYEVRAMEQSILHGTPIACPLAFSKRVLRTLIGLYISIEQHRMVTLSKLA